MANGKPTIKTFEQYNQLTDEQKQYYTFDKLQKIEALYDNIQNLDDRYAQKWVEKFVLGLIGMILVAFAGAVIAGVIPSV